jgi:hypothetical protein
VSGDRQLALGSTRGSLGNPGQGGEERERRSRRVSVNFVPPLHTPRLTGYRTHSVAEFLDTLTLEQSRKITWEILTSTSQREAFGHAVDQVWKKYPQHTSTAQDTTNQRVKGMADNRRSEEPNNTVADASDTIGGDYDVTSVMSDDHGDAITVRWAGTRTGTVQVPVEVIRLGINVFLARLESHLEGHEAVDRSHGVCLNFKDGSRKWKWMFESVDYNFRLQCLAFPTDQYELAVHVQVCL